MIMLSENEWVIRSQQLLTFENCQLENGGTCKSYWNIWEEI